MGSEASLWGLHQSRTHGAGQELQATQGQEWEQREEGNPKAGDSQSLELEKTHR